MRAVGSKVVGSTASFVVVVLMAPLALSHVPANGQSHGPYPTAEVLDGANVHITSVCDHNDPSTWTSDTTAARTNDGLTPGHSITVRDVQVANNVANGWWDDVFFGLEQPFDRLVFDVSQAGDATGVVEWYYSQGGGQWAALTSLDGDIFGQLGAQTASFSPPTGWAPVDLGALSGNKCTAGSLYYVKLHTKTRYAVEPLANQVSARTFNLQVLVTSESGRPLPGLVQGDFTISGGENNDTYRFDEVGAGVYKFALYAGQGDKNFNVRAKKAGYLESADVTTGDLSAGLTRLDTDATNTIKLGYPTKVVVKDEQNRAVNGAAVKLAGADPTDVQGNIHYFAGASGGALSATASGHQSLDTDVDTKLKNVNPGTTTTTTITLGGTAACAGGNSVTAGTSVSCRGLRSLATSNAPPPSNSDDPDPTPGSPAPSDGPVITSNAPEATHVVVGQVTRPDGQYQASIAHVDADTILEINLEAENDPLLDSVTLTFREAADNVIVVVERLADLDPLLGAPVPGGTTYGYITVKVYVGGVLAPGLIESTAIHFGLEQRVLDDYGQNPTGVDLLRYNGVEWRLLQTVPLGAQGEHFQFSAQGPGDGTFAIYGDAAKPSHAPIPWGPLALGVILINLVVGGVLYARRGPPRPRELFP